MTLQRENALARLKNERFDLIVIGGGATGAGVALDAQLRGLKVGLVEKADFSSGTSSRSTKLVHGGVRYLEQAVLHLDRSQFKLVREALSERKTLSQIAPHLVTWLPLLIPMYRRLQASYYHAGLRMYDWLAGKHLVHRSRLVSREEALELCPNLKRAGLKGGVIYYDGQFDDSRMALSILLTAEEKGAVIANYTEVIGFKKSAGKISGVELRDSLSGQVWVTPTTVVVNATGPLTDQIRSLDRPAVTPLLKVSSGAHLVLPSTKNKMKVGVLIPKTKDKRVLFVLPWLNHILVGTTDVAAKLSDNPKPTPDEIAFIKQEFENYFEGPLKDENIQSSWSGLRPLVNEPSEKGTAALSRDHSFDESPSGLLSVFGGKWTTYRLMAEDTVDKISSRFSKPLKPCSTNRTSLKGAEESLQKVTETLLKMELDQAIAEHLLSTYGDQALKVLEAGSQQKLHPNHPVVLAEIVFAARNEFATQSSDVLFRRTRLAFLDKKAAAECYPIVSSILEKELGWTKEDLERDRSDFLSQI